MSEQFQWSIPAQVSHQLFGLTAGPRNPLSWLPQPGQSIHPAQVESVPSSSPVISSDILREAGVLDVQRNVSPSFMRALQVLANPGASFSIRQVLADTTDSFEVYFTNNLAYSVAVIQAGEHITIFNSAQPPLVFDYLSDHIGSSKKLQSTFEVSLPIVGAYALTASIDTLRKRYGRALFNGDANPSGLLNPDEIFKELVNPSPSAQWMVSRLQRRYQDSITSESWLLAFQNLQSQDLCTFQQEGILSTPVIENLAQTMLIMDQVFELDVSRLHRNGQVTQIRQVCFQSGVHDLLIIDLADKQVRLHATTAQAFINQSIALLTEGIRNIPEPANQDITRQINPGIPLWELKPLGAGARIAIHDSIHIGRSPENQVVLSETSVSRSHCLLDIINGACWITDLGSSNGTLVNGKRITLPTRLQEKDRVQLGILKYEVIEIKPNLPGLNQTSEPEK